jgi:hypothetical protein
MKVLRNINALETGTKNSIVVRLVTPLFWEACIAMTEKKDKRYRVAAIGTPGIGKTKSTAILIRILLERKKTVVYLIRTKKEESWYYEFVPNKSDSTIASNVYPENVAKGEILCLRDPSTYYIVDPGETKDSCNPPGDFLPKYILIASPDERHWGESEFDKRRDDVRGCFKLYPIWSLKELLLARKEFEDDLTEDDINERYRLFGGVPRYIFDDEEDFPGILSKQMLAIKRLSKTQAMDIALGQVDEEFSERAGKGVLLGFNSTAEDFGIANMQTFLLSPSIAEKVYSKHIRTLWNTMIASERDIRRSLFEPYIRTLLTDTTKNNVTLEMRGLNNSSQSYILELPICKEIKLVSDPAKHKLKPLVLFHSINLTYPLIDCIYKDESGVVNAIQITTGIKHNISDTIIQRLHNAVGIESQLNLFYFVPSENYIKFGTRPTRTKYNSSKFDAYVVSIPNPNKIKNAKRQDEDVPLRITTITKLPIGNGGSGLSRKSGRKSKK